MANGLNNWSHDDVLEFLHYHGFHYGGELGGSHSTRISEDGKFVVDINLTKSSYPIRTLETMIVNSGIGKEHWKHWTTLNKSLKKKLACCKNSEKPIPGDV